MVAHNIWDVEAQFKSDIFCQIKTLPATHKKIMYHWFESNFSCKVAE